MSLSRVLAYLAPRTTEDGDCLLWNLACNSDGAPVASIDGVRSRPVRRWVHETIHGPAEALRVVPTCGHKRCVAPWHAEAITPGMVNVVIADRGGFGTAAFRAARRKAGRAKAKITLSCARRIRHRRLVGGETLQSIRRDYPLSLSVLSKICRGEAWPDPHGNPFEGLKP